MKAPRIRLTSTRAKIIVITIILLAVLSVSVLAATYRTYQASASASSSGTFSIMWGDPYLTANIGQGSGWETFTVIGNVAKWANVSGYYTYTNFTLQGRLHGQWSGGANTYVLDANLSLERYENGYQNIIINPSADSFSVSFMDYTAILTVNGLANHFGGVAGMKAAAPGAFAFKGQDRATTFILYAPALGDSQFAFQWSKSNQTVDGTHLPAADMFSQTVKLSW